MKKLRNNLIIVIMLLTLHFSSNAQGNPSDPSLDPGLDAGNPGNPGNDPGAAPINDYITLMALTAVCFGYFLTQKRTKNGV